MNKPPPLPVRVCARHGLVAGPDGRCVLCHRDDGARRADGGGAQSALGLVLGALAIAGAVLVWKGTQGKRVEAPPTPAVVVAPPPAAPPPAEAPEEPQPPLPDPVKEQLRMADEEKHQRSIEDEMGKVLVRMFMTKKCDLCDAARDWMNREHVRFTEVDVDADPTGLATLKKIAPPGDQVPVFDVEGETLVGFGPTMVSGAVRRAADKRARSRH
jgi:glutaredoxin